MPDKLIRRAKEFPLLRAGLRLLTVFCLSALGNAYSILSKTMTEWAAYNPGVSAPVFSYLNLGSGKDPASYRLVDYSLLRRNDVDNGGFSFTFEEPFNGTSVTNEVGYQKNQDGDNYNTDEYLDPRKGLNERLLTVHICEDRSSSSTDGCLVDMSFNGGNCSHQGNDGLCESWTLGNGGVCGSSSYSVDISAGRFRGLEFRVRDLDDGETRCIEANSLVFYLDSDPCSMTTIWGFLTAAPTKLETVVQMPSMSSTFGYGDSLNCCSTPTYSYTEVLWSPIPLP